VNLSEAIRLLCVTAVVLHVMPYLENAGFSRAVAGMVAASLGGIIGPTLAGWTFDTLGSYRPIWFALCGLALLGALTAMRIRPPALDPAART
jgi:MFS family permease